MLQRVSRRWTVYVARFGCRRLEAVLATPSRTGVRWVAAACVAAVYVASAYVTAEWVPSSGCVAALGVARVAVATTGAATALGVVALMSPGAETNTLSLIHISEPTRLG